MNRCIPTLRTRAAWVQCLHVKFVETNLCFMTDFHKLFIVKLNKKTHKKTGASFLVAYVIYVSLVYMDSKKTVMFTPPTVDFIPSL